MFSARAKLCLLKAEPKVRDACHARKPFLRAARWAFMSERPSYFGYEIVVDANGEGWRVWAHPRTPDMPITTRRSFHVDAANADEALEEARQRIDDLLRP